MVSVASLTWHVSPHEATLWFNYLKVGCYWRSPNRNLKAERYDGEKFNMEPVQIAPPSRLNPTMLMLYQFSMMCYTLPHTVLYGTLCSTVLCCAVVYCSALYGKQSSPILIGVLACGVLCHLYRTVLDVLPSPLPTTSTYSTHYCTVVTNVQCRAVYPVRPSKGCCCVPFCVLLSLSQLS